MIDKTLLDRIRKLERTMDRNRSKNNKELIEYRYLLEKIFKDSGIRVTKLR